MLLKTYFIGGIRPSHMHDNTLSYSHVAAESHVFTHQDIGVTCFQLRLRGCSRRYT